jgi:inner membrane transporter RhtA
MACGDGHRRGGAYHRGVRAAAVVERASVPAPLLVLAAAASVQVGAAFAKSLFDEVGPPGVVFLRLVFGAAALWLLRRPHVRGRSRRDLRLVVALGVVLAAMNTAFYESLDRLPLGIAVTVEFLGPLAVAVASSRRPLDLLWVGLAAAGIVLLADPSGDLDPLGLALAAFAGVCWGVYIVVGVRVGRAWVGSSGLAVSMVLGAALTAPWGIASGGAALLRPVVLAGGAAVGVLSSALPWSLEIEAMRRLPTHVLGVLMSCAPGIAAVTGLVVLGERIGVRAAASVGLVVVASVGAALGARDPELPPDV